MAEPIVRLEHISMQFPGVLANDDVSLDIYPGEVFALVGENGAGKSTLMNVLYGLNNPTSGEIYVKGKRVERQSPANAIAMGVGMVHQHFKLVPSFTVKENIALCCEPTKRFGLYDFKRAEETVRALSEEFGLAIDPNAKVSALSVGLQQRVEILKTLHRGADVLILDEPTAVLTPQETDELFKVIRGIVENKGMTVIIITHKLYEVMAISDRVGVMRAGKLVGVHHTCDVNERSLASMMVGREMLFEGLERSGECGEEKIRVEKLRVLSERMLPAVRNVSLSVRAGEILIARAKRPARFARSALRTSRRIDWPRAFPALRAWRTICWRASSASGNSRCSAFTRKSARFAHTQKSCFRNSISAARAWKPRRARCPAAICRRSCLRANSRWARTS